MGAGYGSFGGGDWAGATINEHQETNWFAPTDTAGGGPGQLHLYRLFGDANGDGVVDQLDLAIFRSANNSSSVDPNYLAYLDANYDGNIDQIDLAQFRERDGGNVFG